jgi:uncharacterized membrane protein YhaH (DUF805 family)
MRYLFGFHGRLSRSLWWRGQIRVAAGFLLFLVISLAIKGPSIRVADAVQANVSLAILGIGLAFFLWVEAALCVKRLHDRSRSGWFALLALVPPATLWVLFECGILKGASGPNKFGTDPKQPNGRLERVFS